MNQTATTPRPSAAEIRRMLESELSLGARIAYTLLLLFDLAVGTAIVSLWATERGLPARTHIAFGVMTAIALVWAVFFIWTLSRRKVLLARQRVLSGRLAVGFTGVYTAGAMLIALTQDDVRAAGVAAAAMGALMLVIAVIWLARSRRRLAALLERKRVLQTVAVMFLSMLGLAANAQTLTPASFEINVLHAPRVARALGSDHLVYEIHVTNFGADTRRIVELQVLTDANQEVAGAWKGVDLERRAARISPAVDASGSPLVIGPGDRIVFYVWLSAQATIGSLRHVIVSTAFDSGDEHRLVSGSTSVTTARDTTLSPPVGSGRWIAVRGPSNTSGHRRSLVPLDGRVRVPQRFAIDWAKLGDDGRLFDGDGSRNEQWYGYDTPVLSASAGKVVKVVDGIADHEPRVGATDGYSRDSVAGNLVIIESETGEFAVYAHLRSGSIMVKIGQMVAAGDPIGRIGNSGHSLAPHLHFHVADGADALASEGLPFALTRFQLIGRIDSMPRAIGGEPWQPVAQRPAREVRNEMPLENMVIALQ